jgi:cell division protein FtsX
MVKTSEFAATTCRIAPFLFSENCFDNKGEIMKNNNNLPRVAILTVAVLVLASIFFAGMSKKTEAAKTSSTEPQAKQELKLTPRADKENVMIHVIVNEVQKDYGAKLYTIPDLAQTIKGIKNGQFRLGNKCVSDGIYSTDDAVVHITFFCKKILP